MRRAVPALTVAALIALAGCSSHKSVSAETPHTVPTPAPPTTSTTVGVDVIPDVITVEYVQRVMNALDKAEGDATRLLYANKVPNQEWLDRIKAIFDGKAFENAQADFGRDAAHSFDSYRDPPGDPVTTVQRIYDSSSKCVVFGARRDFGPFLKSPPPSELLDAVLILEPKSRDRDADGTNKTAWMITGDGQAKPGVNLEGACHG